MKLRMFQSSAFSRDVLDTEYFRRLRADATDNVFADSLRNAVAAIDDKRHFTTSGN